MNALFSAALRAAASPQDVLDVFAASGADIHALGDALERLAALGDPAGFASKLLDLCRLRDVSLLFLVSGSTEYWSAVFDRVAESPTPGSVLRDLQRWMSDAGRAGADLSALWQAAPEEHRFHLAGVVPPAQQPMVLDWVSSLDIDCLSSGELRLLARALAGEQLCPHPDLVWSIVLNVLDAVLSFNHVSAARAYNWLLSKRPPAAAARRAHAIVTSVLESSNSSASDTGLLSMVLLGSFCAPPPAQIPSSPADLAAWLLSTGDAAAVADIVAANDVKFSCELARAVLPPALMAHSDTPRLDEQLLYDMREVVVPSILRFALAPHHLADVVVALAADRCDDLDDVTEALLENPAVALAAVRRLPMSQYSWRQAVAAPGVADLTWENLAQELGGSCGEVLALAGDWTGSLDELVASIRCARS